MEAAAAAVLMDIGSGGGEGPSSPPPPPSREKRKGAGGQEESLSQQQGTPGAFHVDWMGSSRKKWKHMNMGGGRAGLPRYSPPSDRPVTTPAEKRLFVELLPQYRKASGQVRWEEFRQGWNTKFMHHQVEMEEEGAGGDPDEMLYSKSTSHLRSYHEACEAARSASENAIFNSAIQAASLPSSAIKAAASQQLPNSQPPAPTPPATQQLPSPQLPTHHPHPTSPPQQEQQHPFSPPPQPLSGKVLDMVGTASKAAASTVASIFLPKKAPHSSSEPTMAPLQPPAPPQPVSRQASSSSAPGIKVSYICAGCALVLKEVRLKDEHVKGVGCPVAREEAKNAEAQARVDQKLAPGKSFELKKYLAWLKLSRPGEYAKLKITDKAQAVLEVKKG